MARAALAVARRRRACGERLLRAFADARGELTQAVARVLGNAEDAQDAVQEAFLKCWRGRDRVGDVRNLRAWIFRVALNAARDLRRNGYRRRARPLADQPDVGRPGPAPADEVLHAEALERLRAALHRLRPEERTVFLLRQNSDLTYDQIAQRRKAAVGTVKTQMRAALHKLRAVLRDRDAQ
jgi:RNA polymerase sigma-70 factor (ECF subfamily)